jgi:hypothetical protein
MIKHFCDYCNSYINDSYDEVPITILELPNETLIFCDYDCLRKYINELTIEKYVNYNGDID